MLRLFGPIFITPLIKDRYTAGEAIRDPGARESSRVWECPLFRDTLQKLQVKYQACSALNREITKLQYSGLPRKECMTFGNELPGKVSRSLWLICCENCWVGPHPLFFHYKLLTADIWKHLAKFLMVSGWHYRFKEGCWVIYCHVFNNCVCSNFPFALYCFASSTCQRLMSSRKIHPVEFEYDQMESEIAMWLDHSAHGLMTNRFSLLKTNACKSWF